LFLADATDAPGGALSWREVPSALGVGRFIMGTYFAAGQFVVVTPSEAIATSPDGRTWQVRPVKPDMNLRPDGAVTIGGELRWMNIVEDGSAKLVSTDEAFGSPVNPAEVPGPSRILHAVTASDGARSMMVGVDADDATGALVGGFLGADEAWSRVPTNLGDDVTPLALTGTQGGWVMLARRHVPVGSGTGADAWRQPMLEVRASLDGAEWRTVGDRLADVSAEQGRPVYALAVGPTSTGDGLRTMVAADERVSTRIGTGPWTTRRASERFANATGRPVFAGIDRDGVLIDEHGRVSSHGLVNSREHLDSLFEAKVLGLASTHDRAGAQAMTHPCV
jgi:hypothetical protein